MIKWLISLMMVCSLSVTVSACNPDDSLKNTENTVPEPEPTPDPTPEPVTGNGMFDLSKGENGNPQDAHLAFQGEDGIATDELWSTAQIRQMAVHGWEMLMEYSGLGACGWLERGEN